MIGGKKVLAFIPARGGSKGIKDKNIKNLCGKPLIAYSIIAAQKCKYIDEIFVSTDSQKISSVAQSFGINSSYLRPKELASDTAKTIDCILHALDFLESNGKVFDIFITLQPTSPLRSAQDIQQALELFQKHNFSSSLVSVTESEVSPIFIRTLDSENLLSPILQINSTIRRQDLPKFYKINGAIYINNTKDINAQYSFNDNAIGFVMPQERSIDIDDMQDFRAAESFLDSQK